MADFLSEAWFLAINEALASASDLDDVATKRPSVAAATKAALPFVIAIELSPSLDTNGADTSDTGIDSGNQGASVATSRSWHLRIDNDGARVAPGIPDDVAPALTIFTDADTGRELAAGATNAQRAIDSGRLRVRGDLNALAAMTSVFARLSTIPSPPSHL